MYNEYCWHNTKFLSTIFTSILDNTLSQSSSFRKIPIQNIFNFGHNYEVTLGKFPILQYYKLPYMLSDPDMVPTIRLFLQLQLADKEPPPPSAGII